MLYFAYVMIAFSALAEYCGVCLDGREEYPSLFLAVVKCIDYILTPMAGGALVFQLRIKNRWIHVLIGVLVFNIMLQIISAVSGWMIIIDAHNHYTHGPIYGLYIGIYMSIIIIVLIQFMIYGKSCRKQNLASLYAVIILVITGIIIQELSGGVARTSCIALTIGAIQLYIHYTEFSSMEMDEYLERQQRQIDTDALTGVRSRTAYIKMLKSYEDRGQLPSDLAAFTIDINGLKQVNDSLGHSAGDELICGAAECIIKALEADGNCYRTGGDEFVVLKNMNRDDAKTALQRLDTETRRWRGELVKSLSVSAGYALAEECDAVTAETLVRESDNAMYAAKAAYYQKPGSDRRKRR